MSICASLVRIVRVPVKVATAQAIESQRKEAKGRAGSEPGRRMASVLQGLKAVLLLMLLLASALPGDGGRRNPLNMEERSQASRRHQMRQPRVENGPELQVVDFSTDSDQAPDKDGQYTGASLVLKGTPPPSLTLCYAFMVEAWSLWQNIYPKGTLTLTLWIFLLKKYKYLAFCGTEKILLDTMSHGVKNLKCEYKCLKIWKKMQNL